MNANKRILWLDVARAIAICCVVMCHAVQDEIYPLNVDFMNEISIESRFFAIIAFTVGRIGVPLFLLISGYLLLDKSYDESACIKFWKNKCIGLLIAIEFWLVSYNIFFHFWSGQDISFSSLAEEMLFLKKSEMNHMWYMPMILGLYLTLPIIANALKNIDYKILLIPYIILVILFLGIPALNVVRKAMGFSVSGTLISYGFSGGVYGLYLFTGYFLKKGLFRNIRSFILWFTFVVCFLGAIASQIYSYAKGVGYNIWYDNLFLLIIGACIFELISRMKKIPFLKCITVISYYSFAIYLVHNPINIMLKRCLESLEPRPLRALVVWGVTFVISLLVSFIISKIPKLGKKILYMR